MLGKFAAAVIKKRKKEKFMAKVEGASERALET